MQTTSDSGKISITSFSALQWRTGALALTGGSDGRVDLAVKESGGKHVMLTCEANPTDEGMSLVLTRSDGTSTTRVLDRTGHQFVKFSIPSAPKTFAFSLTMHGGPVDPLARAWLFYGCRMELK